MPSSNQEAIALKNKGNTAVAQKIWQDAIKFYTEAIELDNTDPAFFSNRAQVCHMSQQQNN